jgi:hypothetical protein
MAVYDEIESAEEAREMIRAGLEWLVDNDGYTGADLETFTTDLLAGIGGDE